MQEDGEQNVIRYHIYNKIGREQFRPFRFAPTPRNAFISLFAPASKKNFAPANMKPKGFLYL